MTAPGPRSGAVSKNPAAPAHANRDTARRVVPLFRPYRAQVAAVVGLIVVTSTIGIINPLLIQVVFNKALFVPGGPNLQLLVILVAIMAVVPIVNGAIGILQTYETTRVGQLVMRDLRDRLYSHLQTLSLAFFTGTKTGEIQSRLANDVGVKATLTWVPWTYGRLAYTSGYGAGIRSPGWYDHLFSSAGQPIERWLAMAAAVLREEGVPASSAHVIESVRLAEALAALRGRPLAGLEEVTEAARAVLCEGSDLLVGCIQRRLVVGERLGSVPAATPMMPLQRDLQDQQRSLRLRPEAGPRDYDLDLRKPSDLARSHLLHRLTLLGVRWGVPQQGRTRNIGTFRESWQLTWRPELDLALIEASMWGSTVAAAAAQRARAVAAEAAALEDLTRLVERCLLADLGDVLTDALAAVRDRAALEGDVTHLMAALPALIRAARYGDVRGTDPGRLGEVAVEMITRICAGLPAAVTSLDETAERAVRDRIDAVHSAVGLLADAGSRARWLDTLVRIAPRCPPLISGRLTRLLLDGGQLTTDDAAIRMSRELSAAAPAAAAAGWAEGFLAGSGLLLLHDDKLLSLADGWLAGLSAEAFAAVLPPLRRTFGEFAPPERRAIGDKAVRLDGTGRAPVVAASADDDLDEDRAAIAVRAVAAILGRRASSVPAP